MGQLADAQRGCGAVGCCGLRLGRLLGRGLVQNGDRRESAAVAQKLDLNRVPRGAVLNGRNKIVHEDNRLAVEADDHVIRENPGIVRGAAGSNVHHGYAEGSAALLNHQPEFGSFAREYGHAAEAALAQKAELNRRTLFEKRSRGHEGVGINGKVVVHADDNIARTEAGLGGGAVRLYTDNENAGTLALIDSDAEHGLAGCGLFRLGRRGGGSFRLFRFGRGTARGRLCQGGNGTEAEHHAKKQKNGKCLFHDLSLLKYNLTGTLYHACAADAS